MSATIRTFSERSRAAVRPAVVRMVESIAAAHELTATVSYRQRYPVTVNDPTETAFAARTVTELFGADRLRQMPRPLTASEDFSRVLEQVPGAFILVGACPPDADPAAVPDNHSARARFDDGILGDGARLLAELARRRLDQQGVLGQPQHLRQHAQLTAPDPARS
jgi:hippurate hydrolase